jgi:hypothetical protein
VKNNARASVSPIRLIISEFLLLFAYTSCCVETAYEAGSPGSSHSELLERIEFAAPGERCVICSKKWAHRTSKPNRTKER